MALATAPRPRTPVRLACSAATGMAPSTPGCWCAPPSPARAAMIRDLHTTCAGGLPQPEAGRRRAIAPASQPQLTPLFTRAPWIRATAAAASSDGYRGSGSGSGLQTGLSDRSQPSSPAPVESASSSTGNRRTLRQADNNKAPDLDRRLGQRLCGQLWRGLVRRPRRRVRNQTLVGPEGMS